MRRAAFVVASGCAWLLACDLTLRFQGDAGEVVDVRETSSADAAASRSVSVDACLGAECGVDVSCTGSSCTCPPPTSACSGSCYNLKSDHNHCGECTRACVQGQHCAAGACVTAKAHDAG